MRLIDGLTQLNIPADEKTVSLLERYRDAVLAKNEELNLTAPIDADTFNVRHILDSLAAASFFSNSRNIIDVGSGGGMPGIPLAIIFPQLRITLCESKIKKAQALTDFVSLLGLANVRVENRNVFEVKERYDTVTARAFAELDKIADVLKKTGAPGAQAVCYKGRHATASDEMAKINKKVYTVSLTPVTVPFLNEERCIVLIQRN
ncbi:MAG: 16S rRNA (guanine(527)-N(7))-methyltransferase RsmG [Spirochaetes bacterium]|nr:16S rRNA (guanine(527)-N(7))-methyltransferase RsmG [Spirochaetota bacterium]